MKVDPDQLEDAGSKLKDLAGACDDLVLDVARATRDRAEAFTGGGRSKALLDEFDEAYEIFYNSIYQTSVNIRAMAMTLGDVAENHRMNEKQIERSFEGYEDDIDEARKTRRAVGAQPPAPENKDEPGPYNRGGV